MLVFFAVLAPTSAPTQIILNSIVQLCLKNSVKEIEISTAVSNTWNQQPKIKQHSGRSATVDIALIKIHQVHS